MPATSASNLALAIRQESRGDGRRYVSSQFEVRTKGGELLGTVGGVWDRRRRRYVRDAEESHVLVVHPGQEETMRWFFEWLEGYLLWRKGQGERVKTKADEIVRSMLLLAGRRAGKTVVAIFCLALFAVAVPNSRCWIVVPSLPEMEELQDELNEVIPEGMFRGKPLGAPWFKWTLVNGSRIWIRSAHSPDSLKRGRCDFALLNEGQKMAAKAYTIIRGSTDKGALAIVAANPPDDITGQWIADMQEEAEAGRRPTVCFSWSARDNPEVDWTSLEAMRGEVDDRTFRQEVMGEVLPRLDIVWHAFRPANAQEPGVVLVDAAGNPVPIGTALARAVECQDITTTFLRKHFRNDFEVGVCLDFQLKPYMAATVRRIFAPYWEGAGTDEVIDWTTDEAAVDQGDENDLIDALEGMGLRPESTLCVADASGDWQDAARTKGGASFDMFRRRKWTIVTPDVAAKVNPGILDSFKASNSRLCAADGRRRAFIAPGCLQMIRALKMYENKHGVPNRRSQYAHFSDAYRYWHWRFWPRRMEPVKAAKTGMRTFPINEARRNAL